MAEPVEPEFRNHDDCRILTALLSTRLPAGQVIGRAQRYPKGAFIWTTESADHSIYCLERGQIAIMVNDASGCEVIVRVIDPGEPFGELCFCSARNSPRENSARATIDSESLRIDFAEFMSYLRENPEALNAFTFTFCKRLADAERRIEILSHRGAEARLGRLLLQLASTSGLEISKKQGAVRLTVGHDQLARMAAMSRPHVSVTMGRLRDRGLVRYDRSSQLTVDVAGLAGYLDRKIIAKDTEGI